MFKINWMDLVFFFTPNRPLSMKTYYDDNLIILKKKTQTYISAFRG